MYVAVICRLHMQSADMVSLLCAIINCLGAELLRCWASAIERWGKGAIASLVHELNVSGVEANGTLSTNPDKVAILLEYAPMLVNNAAKCDEWEVVTPITIGLMSAVFRHARRHADGKSNPMVVDINCVAARTNPRYADKPGCELSATHVIAANRATSCLGTNKYASPVVNWQLVC